MKETFVILKDSQIYDFIDLDIDSVDDLEVLEDLKRLHFSYICLGESWEVSDNVFMANEDENKKF